MSDLLKSLPPISLRSFLAVVDLCSSEKIRIGDSELEMGQLPKRNVIEKLKNLLYGKYHSGSSMGAEHLPVPDTEFVGLLAASHSISTTSDPDWRIVAAEDGDRYVAEKDGVYVKIDRKRHIYSSKNLEVGMLASLRLPAERPNVSPGFFSVVSGAGSPDQRAMCRFYCNLKSSSATQFLEHTTLQLEPLGIKYWLKTLNRPEYYGRRDGTVLYVDLSDRQIVCEVLVKVMASLGKGINLQTPALALHIAPGLSFACEPIVQGSTMSFGQHRCQALAEAIWDAKVGRSYGISELETHVQRVFAKRSIDPDRPYLNLAAIDYD